MQLGSVIQSLSSFKCMTADKTGIKLHFRARNGIIRLIRLLQNLQPCVPHQPTL